MDPLRGPDEALAIGVLADLDQDLPDRFLDAICRDPRRMGRGALDRRGGQCLGIGAAEPAVGVGRQLPDLGLDLVDDLLYVWRQRRHRGGLLFAPMVAPSAIQACPRRPVGPARSSTCRMAAVTSAGR